MITDADSSIEYLNSGGRNAVSIVLETDIRQGIMNKYGLDSSEDFAGCYVLVFGRLKKSQRGKKYIRPYDMSWICLNMPTDEEVTESSTSNNDVEDSPTLPISGAHIHPHDGFGEVCQADSTHQWDA